MHGHSHHVSQVAGDTGGQLHAISVSSVGIQDSRKIVRLVFAASSQGKALVPTTPFQSGISGRCFIEQVVCILL